MPETYTLYVVIGMLATQKELIIAFKILYTTLPYIMKKQYNK